MVDNEKRNGRWHTGRWGVYILLALWIVSALVDILWGQLDRGVASWDPADHLIGSLNYGWMLHHPQPFSGEWWTGLWTLSSKYPPLLYIATSPLLSLLGRGPDQAVLVNLFFTGVLLASVYRLGQHLFTPRVGLWAAGLCLLFPRLYTTRIQYFMDYPLVALVAASFCSLTLWRDAKGRSHQWLWAIGFGLCFGLALLMKQSALFFLVAPLLWVIITNVWQRQWERIAQLFLSGLIAILVFLPWLTTNWVFQVSAGFNSNVKSALSEGDPPLTTLAAWTYYWHDLPHAVSWPLFIVPLVGLLLAQSPWFPRFRDREADYFPTRQSWVWLGIFFLGSYLLWSAIFNKDLRYIMPYLPVVAVILAYGLTCWNYPWRWIRWVTVGLAGLLLVLNLFPIGGSVGSRVAQLLSPASIQHPYLGAEFPHQAVVDEIIQAQPYQIHNLGLLQSTATINQHNFTYYGNRRDFRVYGRRIANDDDYVEQDVRSFAWILHRAGDRDPSESSDVRRQRAEALELIKQDNTFRRHKTWELPDGDRLVLFHRRLDPVEVQPLEPGNSPLPSGKIQLQQITVPPQSPPGVPIPVTYTWTGSWEQLHEGLVLLTWRNPAQEAVANQQTTQWLHDHGIGLGTLYPKPIQANQGVEAEATVEPDRLFQVVERTAMLPPEAITPGLYTLEATYLNRKTGETYSIPSPPISLTINSEATPTPSPEVDWVSQLRSLATNLPDGLEAIDPVFEQLGRINLYDPVQNYTVQAEETLAYRLQHDPGNAQYAYGLALSRVLQRKVDPAIAALQQVVALDQQNPYAYAYLAFVNLYAFRPKAAQQALQPALNLAPESPELHALSGVAALMQGNLWQAWQQGQIALKHS